MLREDEGPQRFFVDHIASGRDALEHFAAGKWTLVWEIPQSEELRHGTGAAVQPGWSGKREHGVSVRLQQLEMPQDGLARTRRIEVLNESNADDRVGPHIEIQVQNILVMKPHLCLAVLTVPQQVQAVVIGVDDMVGGD